MSEVNISPFAVLNWNLRTQLNFWDDCLICNSKEKIEMHHVKHIRKEGEKISGFTKIMSNLNRKQIPVCHACHMKIHAGKYDGKSISELRKNIQ